MSSSLSFLGLAFYVLVLIGAFAVRSAAGFGAGLIAVPMLAFVLPVSISEGDTFQIGISVLKCNLILVEAFR